MVNVTNQNFVPVQIVNFTVQGLVLEALVGKTKKSDMEPVPSRSQKSVSITQQDMTQNIIHGVISYTSLERLQYIYQIDLPIKDKGLK